MKLDATFVTGLRELIAPLDTEETRERYKTGQFPRSAAVVDLNKRYRWDLFYAVRGYTLLPEDRRDIFDTHIYTALKRVVPPLIAE
jgi:hypothetical protein